MTINVLRDHMMQTVFFSLAAAIVVFIAMLSVDLTLSLHPTHRASGVRTVCRESRDEQIRVSQGSHSGVDGASTRQATDRGPTRRLCCMKERDTRRGRHFVQLFLK